MAALRGVNSRALSRIVRHCAAKKISACLLCGLCVGWGSLRGEAESRPHTTQGHVTTWGLLKVLTLADPFFLNCLYIVLADPYFLNCLYLRIHIS